jgi:WD40 repeat protein
MRIDKSAKKQIIQGWLGFVLFILIIAACSNGATKTPPPPTSTKSSEPTSYQFVLEKSLGKGIAEAADWAPDGSSFALATSVQVDLYDAKTLEILATLDTKQWNKVIAYSPDSRLLAVGDKNGTIQIWDVASRKLLHKLIPTGKQVLYSNVELAFSPDSKQLVSSLYQALYLWDLDTGALLNSFPGYLDEIESVAISPGGKVVVATGYRTLFVRDTSTKKLLYPPLELKDDIEAVLFEQDGKRFKTVSSEKNSNLGSFQRGSSG